MKPSAASKTHWKGIRMDKIVSRLYGLQDLSYRDFTAPLVPNVSKDNFIGVRLPELKKMAKEMPEEERGEFFKELPHTYHDENILHAFLINRIKDYDRVIKEIGLFLPYVNSWSVSDTLSPDIFHKHKKELEERIHQWIASDHTYTIRFGILCRMKYYLKEDFDPVHLEEVSKIDHEDYYVKMMIAWYLATAMILHYEDVLPYLKERRLSPEVHKMTIRKAVESRRISEEHKGELKKLRD